ncbi:MAG: Archaeal ATPase, partial [Clostridia bacterium]|nr:Archaeal ATPase [Clostridia bacterium]
MERCDFASVTKIMRDHIAEGALSSQPKFVSELFISYNDKTGTEFDMSLANKWLNGLVKTSPQLCCFYYNSGANKKELEITIEDSIIPMMTDSSMAVKKINELIICDPSISEKKKAELTKNFPCETIEEEAKFMAEVIIFGMTRKFIERDIREPKKNSGTEFSPLISDRISNVHVPKPCTYFCGRDDIVNELHETLTDETKIFISGIPGIGKSEIARAYAVKYKKEYTNVLYMTYSGNLKDDITELEFTDDEERESSEERFRRHERFLHQMKEDTLIIVDNFDVHDNDEYLDSFLGYRCRIIFTTRNNFPERFTIDVEEIDDEDMLFALFTKFYSNAVLYKETVYEIIELLHNHTLAVELAARLLKTGILSPATLLSDLKEEKMSLRASDKIYMKKDGKSVSATYYEHIHRLFSLYVLNSVQKNIMMNMALMPLSGLSAKLFGKWLGLSDLNDVNKLTELGFIKISSDNTIWLHPVMQEIVISEIRPGIKECRALLGKIQDICLHHGTAVPFYRTMFQVVENVISVADKADRNDKKFYFYFLQDVFYYMDSYAYKTGMSKILEEMKYIAANESFAGTREHALTFQCMAFMADDYHEAIAFMDKAREQIENRVNRSNALLMSNIYANLSSYYNECYNSEKARYYLEKGIKTLVEFQMTNTHDYLVQMINYAVLLSHTGEYEYGLQILDRVWEYVDESDTSFDYAVYLEAYGSLYLCLNEKDKAKS